MCGGFLPVTGASLFWSPPQGEPEAELEAQGSAFTAPTLEEHASPSMLSDGPDMEDERRQALGVASPRYGFSRCPHRGDGALSVKVTGRKELPILQRMRIICLCLTLKHPDKQSGLNDRELFCKVFTYKTSVCSSYPHRASRWCMMAEESFAVFKGPFLTCSSQISAWRWTARLAEPSAGRVCHDV